MVDAHNNTSWIDHIICSYDVNSKISSINILDKLPGSDHLPLQMTLDIDFNSAVDFIDNLCPRDKVSFNWSKCTLNELSQYCCLTYDLFTDIHKGVFKGGGGGFRGSGMLGGGGVTS